MTLFANQKFLAVYSGVLTIAFASVVLGGAARTIGNASFDQITVHRINVVEPNGLTRMVISDNAEFPGAYFRGKEYPRPDRDVTGMIFNNDEGTENGGLVFGGKKDGNGTSHSWGHLSFDEYERDQTLVMESSSDGDSRNTYYAVNDDDRPYSLSPQYNADWQKVKAMPSGPDRVAAGQALRVKYPGDIVNRAYLGRGRDKSVSFVLKDQQGKERLTARVLPDGTPVIEFRDAMGKVTRTIGADTK
jgi:hypothetical protein